MPQKNTAQASTTKNAENQVRVTSSRTFFRSTTAKKMALVPAHDHVNGLNSKEEFCAANATD